MTNRDGIEQRSASVVSSKLTPRPGSLGHCNEPSHQMNIVIRTFPTAASPSSTSFTLLLGFGAAFAESAIVWLIYSRIFLQLSRGEGERWIWQDHTDWCPLGALTETLTIPGKKGWKRSVGLFQGEGTRRCRLQSCRTVLQLEDFSVDEDADVVSTRRRYEGCVVTIPFDSSLP